MRNYVQLLRNNPDYTRLWLAQVISLLGDWFDTITLLALVAVYSPEYQGLAISGLLLARYIPAMALSPFTGVLIDRFDRKRLMIWSNWLRALVVLGLVLTTQGPQWLPLIYLLTVFQFSLSAVFEPAQSAITPSLVSESDLLRANTLGNVTWSAMLAFGAAIGGLVSAVVGANVALLIDSLTFVVAALLIMSIKKQQTKVEVTHETKNDTSFREGLRFLRREPITAATLLIKFGASLGNIDTLMTIFATQIFVLGMSGQLSLGIMYSAFGVGAIIGPILLNRFNDGSVPSMRRLIIVGFAFASLGWFVLGSALSLVVVCIALILRGMGGSVNWTYSTVMIQKLVPNSYLGRMFSLDMAIFYLATVISTIAHGSAIDALGAENIRLIAFGTMGVSFIPLIGWAWFTRRVQRQEVALPQT
ncbi:MAG: MFS transporter [Chloroflexota bacterium]